MNVQALDSAWCLLLQTKSIELTLWRVNKKSSVRRRSKPPSYITGTNQSTGNVCRIKQQEKPGEDPELKKKTCWLQRTWKGATLLRAALSTYAENAVKVLSQHSHCGSQVCLKQQPTLYSQTTDSSSPLPSTLSVAVCSAKHTQLHETASLEMSGTEPGTSGALTSSLWKLPSSTRTIEQLLSPWLSFRCAFLLWQN